MAKRKTRTKADESLLVLTPEGYEDLIRELQNRKEVLRVEIADSITAARELGDLSENQAYTDAMERKELNDTRIDELEYLLSIAKVVEVSASGNLIGMGHTIEIQRVGGDKRVITLVGHSDSQQADPIAGRISIDSPIGLAVNNAMVGDTVIVELPSGKVNYKILRVV